MTYDAEIIRTTARQLYLQARLLEILHAVIGAVVLGGPTLFCLYLLFLIKLLAASMAPSTWFGSSPLPTFGFAFLIAPVLFAALGGLIGFWWARARSHELRLRAQLALCLVRIEEKSGG